jgi:small ligand-binding sensory domain FIST
MRWASAASDITDLHAAIAAVSHQVTVAMQGDTIDLAVLFVSPHFAAQYAAASTLLQRHIAAVHVLGCSAGGVIGDGREIEQRPGVALVVAHLPDVEITPFRMDQTLLPNADSRPGAWHEAIGIGPQPAPHFLLLADPFSFPIEPLLTGMDYAFPTSVKVGGLASGASQPAINALYLDDAVYRDGAVGLALSGNIVVDPVVAQGCRPIGRLCNITQCDGPMLFALDDKPALQVLQDLAESLSAEDRDLLSTSLFLGVVTDEMNDDPGPGDFLIRNIMGIDPTKEALAVGERLRNGRRVPFHLRDRHAASEDLRMVLQRFAASPGAGARARA